MKPPAFEYHVAESVEAAVARLAKAGSEAKVLAGGQSLVPMLNFRLLRPAILVDINRIPGLAFINDTGREIRVGALTRHHQLESSPVIAEHLPVLRAAMTDRKSTRLNSSHDQISYAVFCLKKKKKKKNKIYHSAAKKAEKTQAPKYMELTY